MLNRRVEPLRPSILLMAVLLAGACVTPSNAAPGRTSRGRSTESLAAPQPRRAAADFSNRVGARARIEPSAQGRLVAPAEGTPATMSRPLELAAGYTLRPGGDAPRLPADLARLSGVPESGAGRTGYLVRLAGGSPDEARARILRTGGTIAAAFADGTWLVRMDAGARSRLAAEGGDAWLHPWEPAFKLSPRIDRAATGRVELVALLFPDANVQVTAGGLARLDATRVRTHRNDVNRLVRFEVDRAGVAAVAALADVQWIEPAPEFELLNDRSQWVVQTGTPESRRMWDLGLNGEGQIVMESDSGIRTNHMMFYDAAQDITGFGHYPAHRKIVAYLPGSDDPRIWFGDESALSFHGTHVGGTIAGNDEPNSSTPLDGVARGARLWFMDLAGDPSGSPLYPPDDLNELFLPSYLGNAAGAARISSNSWGASVAGNYTLSSMQVDQFMWNHRDYLIAFANGNNAFPATVNAPASAKNCLSVGGTGNGNLMNRIFIGTSRGPTQDARRKPTVCAPGEDVYSSVGNTRYAYMSYTGTSMATPAAAGGMALVRQYLTEGWYPLGVPVAANAIQPSAALLKAMAVGAAMNDVVAYAAPDFNVGWGRLDLDQVLYFPGDSARTLVVDETDGLVDGGYAEYQVRVVDASQPLRVALCWTDAPGNPAVLPQLVNDLDLVVTNGVDTYLGNRFALGYSRVGGSRDSANVEEGVRIAVPGPGLWTVRVEAPRVLLGPQPFALCITGTIAGDGGALALDRFDYALDDTLRIEVVDTDATGPPTVTVVSSTEPSGEAVTLAGGNGVFRGALPLSSDWAQVGDGRLSVSSGDAITAAYAGAGAGVELHASAQVRADAPMISDVRVRPMSSSASLVTWTTDIAATSRVRYGTAPPLASSTDSSGLTNSHRVLVTGLESGSTYRYDVESASITGSVARDSLGGAHRSFTVREPGQFGLVLEASDTLLVDTWTGAIDALGWQVDILTGGDADAPLVGDAQAGLRRYSAVMWQPDPEVYPPLNAAQRSAVDSLIEGGARLFVTGHDIGYALSDAASPVYSPETEAWLERGLKTRYLYDIYWIENVYGVAGDPVTGAWTGGVRHYPLAGGMSGDLVMPAPGADGTGASVWLNDGLGIPVGPIGIRWESDAAKGVPGGARWGGEPSRLVSLNFEWSVLGSLIAAHEPLRTSVLEQSLAWLLGHRAPSAHIVSPTPGQVVTGEFLPVRWSIAPDSGRAILERRLSYSLDGGDSWTEIVGQTGADSGLVWDLGAALGGTPVPNSTRVMLRLVVQDDGSPALSAEARTAAEFTIARAGGDPTGPVVVAGSVRTSPTPVLRGIPATLMAKFSDAETGGADVTAAEFSWGAAPAGAGGGNPMAVATPGPLSEATAGLPTGSLPQGNVTLWLRARDAAGNWGPAASLNVIANGDGVTAVEDESPVAFLAAPFPNPSHGASAIHFGLARAGDVRLELYDVGGRLVRRLAGGRFEAGSHVASWDGRNAAGRPVGAGVYFVRLVTPTGTFRSRIVSLR